MAEKPYKIYDRRGQNRGQTNRLIPAATSSYDRQRVPSLRYDTHNSITTLGLSKLRDISRYLMWKYPIVQGALLEQANLSVSHFIPQFAGSDSTWGDQATEFLMSADENFDIRGWPHDRDSYLNNLILHTRIDGSFWTLLTESASGFPMVQVIPAHRIGGLSDPLTVGDSDNFSPPNVTDSDGNVSKYEGAKNPWAGRRIVAGAIVNDFGTALAYRVYEDNSSVFTDISAQSLFPAFLPINPDLVVGIPALAVCAFDLQDVGETRDFEKLAQKAAARITLIETNEGGEPPPGVDIVPAGSSGSASLSGGLSSEVLEGGIYHYLKGGTGSSIATLVADRPTANQQSYEDRILRGAFYALEWSYDFTLHPGSAGGAEKRVIVEKINRTCEKNRRLAAKIMSRVDGFRIAKAIKLKVLPPNDEWWKWEYQGPSEITADRKYESEIDLEENSRGWLSDEDACGKRGLSEPKQKQRKEQNTRKRWDAAKRISSEFKITIQEAYASLWEDNPNGVSSASGTASASATKQKQELETKLPTNKRRVAFKRDAHGTVIGFEEI